MTKLDRIRSHATAVASRVITEAISPYVARTLERRRPVRDENFPFMLYFADIPTSSYQVRQWLRPLEALDAELGRVALLLANPLVAHKIREATHLTVALASSSATVEEFTSRHKVRVIFYVNNNQANFTTLRINGPAHVHLSHGESEKVSMVSHQLKAYDFAFIAGQAAEDRIQHNVPRLDPSQLIHIGRPQLQILDYGKEARDPSGRVVVLYAPTWEGDSKEMSYSSLVSHGLPLVKLLVNDPRVRLIFRPHPKTGVESAKYRSALRSTLKLMNQESARSAGHTVDRGKDPLAGLVDCDVAICDISAMAMDAIGLERPMVLCYTGNPTSEGLMHHVRSWGATIPKEPGTELVTMARSSVSRRQQNLRTHIFGQGKSGNEIGRFIEASKHVAGL